jgi:hypothetical protein
MKGFVFYFLLFSIFSFGQRSDFKHIDFQKADSIAHYYKGQSLKNLPVLTHHLTANLTTDVEKFRAIYTWVSTNIENDYSSYVKTVKKRKKLFENKEALLEWNNNYAPKVFENLLKHRKTACTGYAYLIRELAGLAGIQCKIVNGFGRTATLSIDENSIPNHSWNAIELNGKWYLCDPTWSAGKIYIDENGPRFQADYFDGYFLADPALFIKNHFPLDLEWTLTDIPPTFKDFTEGPVVYKEAFGLDVIPVTPIKMHLEAVKNDQLSFRLNSPKTLKEENLFLVLKNGSSSKTITPEIKRIKNDYVLQHTFDKSGRFDVHIMVEETIIATYVVKIKRK